MKCDELSTTAFEILSLLSNGEIVSGSDMAQILAVSRTAVWKHIKSLQAYGYKIQSITAKGYQMTVPTYPILKTAIESFNTHWLNTNVDITILSKVDSTNSYVKMLSNESRPQLCIAEQQSSGRGRFNRTWYSPFGKNIYMSYQMQIGVTMTDMSGFSLVIGFALINALSEIGLEPEKLNVKWPNDIWYDGKKISGILIELMGEVGDTTSTTIGIGINANMTEAEIDKDWTSVKKILTTEVDRNKLISLVIKHLQKLVAIFEQDGFAAFHKLWQAKDALKGHLVDLDVMGARIKGICCGVDEMGNLLIQHNNGELKAYSAGELSFHQ